jgi:hypothetical protein
VIVNVALTTGESPQPFFAAMARIVVVVETWMGAEYTVPVAAVGTEPSVV